ncbi:MAG: hypothetical protein AABW58_02215 [Nanoarchaeota archaeon]
MVRQLTVDYEVGGQSAVLYSGKKAQTGLCVAHTYEALLSEITSIFLSKEGQNSQYKVAFTPEAKRFIPKSRRDLVEKIVELQNKAVQRPRKGLVKIL